MKRTNALLAVAAAAVLIGAGLWVMLPGKGDDLPHNDDEVPDVPDVPGNLADPIAKVPHAAEIDEKDVKLHLELDYPGKGAGTEYAWNEAYEFVLSTSGSGWEGRTVIKVFAERAESIGAKCLIMTYDGVRAAWDDHVVHGVIHLSADTVVWASNGTDDRTDRFSVLFNRTGTFGLTFQAFDADTGNPLSAPVSTGKMVVPAAGSMDIRALSRVEEIIENDVYYVVLINATNGWNVRHSMDAGFLILSSDNGEVLADVNRTTFTAQLLEPGQSTQFLAYFPMEDIGDDLELIYAEPGRPPVVVPLE